MRGMAEHGTGTSTGRDALVDGRDLKDEDLMLRSAGGDARAFARLYDRHAKVAWSIAYDLVRDHEAAEDLVQEAFLTAWRQAAGYSLSRGSVRAWILAIVHNRGVDRLRQSGAERRRLEAIGQLAVIEPDAPSPADTAMRNVAAAQVRSALHGLPQEQLRVIGLAYYGGYTHHEIAEGLGVPLGTVKNRMRLGLASMRRALGAAEITGGAAGVRTPAT